MDNLNQLKSKDQMEVSALMIMQMDKLQFDVSGSARDSSSNFLDSSPVASPSSFPPNTPSTVPFSIDHNPIPPLQEQTRQPHMHSNSSARNMWKNTGEVSGTDYFALSIEKQNRMAAMKEMMFRIAAMKTIHIDPESVKPPKRRNVKTSKDPQSIAARHRRERISERIRILQRLVPGGTRMDTASMLDEAIHYVKFLKTQVQSLERYAAYRPTTGIGFPLAMSSGGRIGSRPYLPPAQTYEAQNVQYQDYADA